MCHISFCDHVGKDEYHGDGKVSFSEGKKRSKCCVRGLFNVFLLFLLCVYVCVRVCVY